MNINLTSEETQLIAFTIISHSGSARVQIHEAFKTMRLADFSAANQLLENANEEILKAHQSQTALLQNYANGAKIEMDIIMVHAQDHLMTTMTLREVAIEMAYMYEHNHELMKKLNTGRSENV